VLCTDTKKLIEKVTELRGKSPDQLVYSKLGIDGGRGTLKVELALLYDDDSGEF
jgi:hypothetical protein